MRRSTLSPVLFGATVTLAGCWTAPVSNVQPKGEARLIETGIAVESVKAHVVVESVDRTSGTIVVRIPGAPQTSTYKVSRAVENFNTIGMGSLVKATVKEELSVYVLRHGRAPGANGALETIAADARVLAVDQSYRLLRLQYPNGEHETVKVALGVKLKEMEAGDVVVIKPIEVVNLQQKR